MARVNDTGRGDETAPPWWEASAGAEDGARSAGHRRGESRPLPPCKRAPAEEHAARTSWFCAVR